MPGKRTIKCKGLEVGMEHVVFRKRWEHRDREGEWGGGGWRVGWNMKASGVTMRSLNVTLIGDAA